MADTIPLDAIPKGLGSFVTDAYSIGDRNSMVAFYAKWAEEYDQQMLNEGYTSPKDISLLLDQHLPTRNAQVLDIGCGTGLTGKHISEKGLKALDGIDLSKEMLQVADSRGIYRNLVVADINEPLPLSDRVYDAAISSGTFTHGHVGAEPIPEILRTIKPNGLLACTVHFDLWHSRGFDAVFAELIKNGQIQCLSISEGPYFESRGPEGWFCVYQKN